MSPGSGPGSLSLSSMGASSEESCRFGRLGAASEAPIVAFWPLPFMHWRDAGRLIRVEQYREDGTLVIRADLPGIDPDKDAELTVSREMLHIEADRREER